MDDKGKESEVNTKQALPMNNVKETPTSALDRVGLKTVMILSGSFIVEVACIGFISFLWYGTISNSTWHRIVVNGWVTRAVTLTSLALRIAVAAQGAACLSMLAAMTLERVAVPIGSVVDISLMRAGNKTDLLSVLLGFVWPMISTKGSKKSYFTPRVIVLVFVALILATTTLFQFVSTVLVGDLALQEIPGENKTSNVFYDYEFTNAIPDPNVQERNHWWIGSDVDTKLPKYGYTYPITKGYSYWQVKAPTTWPAFAEYSEPPYEADHVSDTGVSLRAFLPLASVEDRQSLRNYTGKAVVLDSRVTCQKPLVTESLWNFTGWNFVEGTNGNNSYFGTLQGVMAPSTKTPKLNTANHASGRFKFSCGVNLFNTSIEIAWSICQIGPTFGALSASAIPGNDLDYWSNGLDSELHESSNHNYTQQGRAFLVIAPSRQRAGGVPVDTATSPYTRIRPKIGVNGTRLEEFDVTLCYASLDAADRYIEAYSDRKRTEPSALFHKDNNTLDMSSVVHQLDTGYLTPGARPSMPEERGVLRLKKRTDWAETTPHQLVVDGPDQLAYIQNPSGWLGLLGGPLLEFSSLPDPQNAGEYDPGVVRANLVQYLVRSLWIGTGLMPVNKARYDPADFQYTAVLTSNYTLESVDSHLSYTPWPNTPVGTIVSNNVNTQDWVTNIFKGLKTRPAVALQSLITSIAGMAYYDRISQYTKSTPVSQVFFVTALSPGGPYGQRRDGVGLGYLATIILLIIHLVLSGLVVAQFVIASTTTRIGDGWQAVAQVAVSDECKPIIDVASAVGGNQKRVRDAIKSEGMRDMHVILESAPAGVRFRRST